MERQLWHLSLTKSTREAKSERSLFGFTTLSDIVAEEHGKIAKMMVDDDNDIDKCC